MPSSIPSSELTSLLITHVFGVLVLLGTVFYASAGAPESRKKVLMWSGIASLLVLLTGGRLWMVLKPTFVQQGWLVVKLVCWLGLSAFGGFAYRWRDRACLWLSLSLVLALVALVMVFVRPF